MKTKEKNCKVCNKKFPIRNSLQKYCSYPCAKASQKMKPQGAKKPLKKKNRQKVLTKKLDAVWAQYIKERARSKCEYCGDRKYIQAHHIYTRSNFSTRWDIDNGVALCAGCHTMSSKFSAHKTPLEFIEWLKEKKGEEFCESLKRKAKSLMKPPKEIIYIYLCSLLKKAPDDIYNI